MNMLPLTIIVITCLLILIEDFKQRSVSFVLFVSLFISSLSYSFTNNHNINDLITTGLINLLSTFSILIISILLASAVRSITIPQLIGMGDVVFLISICTLFNPVENILFLLLSCIFSLLIYLMLKHFKMLGSNSDTIPLAGLQSLWLIAILLTDYFKIFKLQELTSGLI